MREGNEGRKKEGRKKKEIKELILSSAISLKLPLNNERLAFRRPLWEIYGRAL